MFYGKINTHDIANGPGVRVSLFVSGCRNHCKGCFNPETWDFKFGKRFDIHAEVDLFRDLGKEHIAGLSILGGDPMEPENRCRVTGLCDRVKEYMPEKTIWVYTGYLYEDLQNYEIMRYIDVLVDGPFVQELKDITLQYRGSKNQRIIDVQASRKAGQIILWDKHKDIGGVEQHGR